MVTNSLFTKLATIIISTALILFFSGTGFAQQNSTAKQNNEKQAEKPKTPLGTLLDDQPTTYTAKQTYKQTSGYTNTIVYTQKVNLQRIDTNQEGVDMVVISRPDKEKNYMLVPSKQGYSELYGNALFLRKDPFYLQQARNLSPKNVKIEEIGSETIDGHPCTKYKISFDEANNVKSVTIWKAKDLQGLIVRQDLQFLNFSDSVVLSEINLNVSDSMFEIPQDLKHYNTTQEMFQKKPAKDPYAETIATPK